MTDERQRTKDKRLRANDLATFVFRPSTLDLKPNTMRTINKIIIHCSATCEGLAFTAKDIDRWHRQRGYTMIGYHYVILLDGTVEKGRPIKQIGAHCKGHNAHSIGICYIGGLDEEGNSCDTRTPAQRIAMKKLIDNLLVQYPNATVHCHNEFANKDCPCFKIEDL